MTKVRRAILSILGSAAMLAVLAPTALGWGQHPVGSANPTADEQAAFDAIFARFAAQLGTDEATVNAAFVAAVNETADEAVQNGQVSAEEAEEIKALVARIGLKGLVASANPGDTGQGQGQADKGKGDGALQAAWIAAGTTLGIDARQMKQQLAAGKSLAAIASEQGIDVAQLRAAMLSAARAELGRAVRDGVISQADADARYDEIGRWVDDLMRQGTR